jgi:hypothetical protein
MQAQSQGNAVSALRQETTKTAGHFQPKSSVSPQTGVTRTKKKSTAKAPGKPGRAVAHPKINITAEWDDAVHAGLLGLWGATQSDTGAALVYRWERNYWREQTQAMGETLLTTWIAKEHPNHRGAEKATAAWKWTQMRLRATCPLPERQKGQFIIPLADTYLSINQSGVVEAIEPNPKYGMTYSIKCALDGERGVYAPQPVPVTSLFHKFITHAMPDPAERAVLQEQCAMSLLPGRKSEAAWWHGKAGAGKGEMTELIKNFHIRCGTINLFTLDKEFALEPCYGASLVTCDEVDRGKWKESQFKTFVTGNSMAIGRKGITNIHNYSNHAFVIINSNPPPFFTDPSNGVARRIIPLEWRYAVDEMAVEKDIAQKIFDTEARIVLDWLLEGVSRIVKRGGKMMPHHELPESVRNFKANLVIENNVVRKWASDEGVRGHLGCEHSKHDVYAHYVAWAEADGAKILEHDVFWRMLWDLPEFAPFRNSGRQTTVAGVRARTVRLALSLDEHNEAEAARKYVRPMADPDAEIEF